jgi:photosystem II stability/assembly factor-like uncharacterized protein
MPAPTTHDTMTRMLKPLLLAGAALCAQAAATAAPPAARGEPIVAAAARVPQAAQAALLGSARAGARTVAVGERGVIMLSDDDGRTFRQAREVPVDATLTGVSFADEKRGWAVGHWGVVLATRDGGETWAVQRMDVAVDRPLFAVHFFDERHGVAVGLWSLVLVTDDGGAQWRPVALPPPEGARKADLNLMGLFADRHGRLHAAAERGMVLTSDDRGASWRYAATGYKGSFWTGLALPGGVLLAGGLRGSLYRSADEGRNWSRVDTASTSSITAMAARDGEVIAVGLDGLVLRSKDGGASFTRQVRPDRAALTGVATTASGRTLFFSRRGAVDGPASNGAN